MKLSRYNRYIQALEHLKGDRTKWAIEKRKKYKARMAEYEKIFGSDTIKQYLALRKKLKDLNLSPMFIKENFNEHDKYLHKQSILITKDRLSKLGK